MNNSLSFHQAILSAPLYVAGARIEDIAARYGVADIIKLASNENPLGPSPKATRAMRDLMGRMHLYPTVSDDELRHALAATLGDGLTPDHFFSGNGGCDVLSMVVRGFVNPGDETLVTPPTFIMYEILTQVAGGRANLLYLHGPDYEYDLDRVLDAVTPQTRLVFLCCPNNPPGNILHRGDFEQFLDRVPPGVIVVLDEAYREYASADDQPDSLRYINEGRDVIAVRSFSKIYGLAGLRVGYGIARPEIAQYLRRLHLPFHMGTLALAGAVAALGDTDFVARSVRLVATEREFLYQGFAELDISYLPSQTNFIAFDPTVDTQVLFDDLLKEGVIVRPLAAFRLPTHARVTVGTHEQNERFLAALRRVLERMRAEGRGRRVAEEVLGQSELRI
ncbi:MAG: histidinol-phosphate transaminase [Ardenticatenaceae bacterium]|nr:histidinol-phosphate transaminase [Ardenticatenaceae bacterium]